MLRINKWACGQNGQKERINVTFGFWAMPEGGITKSQFRLTDNMHNLSTSNLIQNCAGVHRI